MEKEKPFSVTKQLGETQLKQENESGNDVIVYYAEYGGSKTEKRFMVKTNYMTPVAESLRDAIQTQQQHPRRTRFGGLRISLDNTSMELVNPNAFSGFFNEQFLKYKFSGEEKNDDQVESSCRNYQNDFSKQWCEVYIDQRTSVCKIPALKFSYPGLIRLDGIKEESLGEALQKDGRFIQNVFNKRMFQDKNKYDCPPDTPMEKLHKQTIILNLSSSPSIPFSSMSLKGKQLDDVKQTLNLDDSQVNSNTPDQCGAVNISMNSTTSRNLSSFASTMQEILPVSINMKDDSLIKIAEKLNHTTGLDWVSIFKERKDRTGKDHRKNEEKISAYIQNFSSKRDESYTFELHEKLSKFGKLVCYIQSPGDIRLNEQHLKRIGTGFSIGVFENKDDSKKYVLILTCWHVAEVFEQNLSTNGLASHCFVVFNYHKTHKPNDPPLKCFPILPNGGILAKNKSLDYALLVLEQNGELLQSFESEIGLGQQIRKSALGPNEVLKLVGHPEGKPKQIDSLLTITDVRSEIQLAIRDCVDYNPNNANFDDIMAPNKMFYNCSSFGGSSGSPCFDQSGQLVCMHTAGFWLDVKKDRYQLNKRSVLEIGVPVLSIVKDLEQKVKSGELNSLTIEKLHSIFPVLNC